MIEITMHRDETGKATIGDTTIHVPKDQSVLSVMGHNRIQDGDDFREDGWVYGPDGEQRRKWFVSVGHWDSLMWAPKLKNLAALEAKRWKWHNRMNVHNRPFFGPVFERAQTAIDEATRVCGRAKIGGWAEITVREANKTFRKIKGWVELVGNPGVGWGWVEGKPDNINQPVVDEWMTGERRWLLSAHRYGLIKAAFEKAVDDNYWEKWVAEAGDYTRALRLLINGRDYWFRRAPRNAQNFFEKIAWPEDTQTEIITATV